MCFLNIGGNTKPTIKPPYNSCLWLLWDLVELPLRINFLQNRNLSGHEFPQQTTGSGTLAVIVNVQALNARQKN